MSHRSDYCIVNELDDIRSEIQEAQSAIGEPLESIRKFLSELLDSEKIDDDTWRKYDDLLDEISGASDDIDNKMSDFDDLVAGADQFAREHLESAREDGYNDGFESGSESGYDDGYRQGIEDAKCDDCIEHYEEFVWEWFEEWFGNGKVDAVTYHTMSAELRDSLADSKFEN